jgi:tRNA U38,U39,U40 pseudouridine synthase TruA
MQNKSWWRHAQKGHERLVRAIADAKVKTEDSDKHQQPITPLAFLLQLVRQLAALLDNFKDFAQDFAFLLHILAAFLLHC